MAGWQDVWLCERCASVFHDSVKSTFFEYFIGAVHFSNHFHIRWSGVIAAVQTPNALNRILEIARDEETLLNMTIWFMWDIGKHQLIWGELQQNDSLEMQSFPLAWLKDGRKRIAATLALGDSPIFSSSSWGKSRKSWQNMLWVAASCHNKATWAGRHQCTKSWSRQIVSGQLRHLGNFLHNLTSPTRQISLKPLST